VSKKTSRLLLCSVLLVSCERAKAQAIQSLGLVIRQDPIFGISYNPSVVKYQQLSPEFRSRCALFQGKQDHLWLFAHVRSEGSDYYVIMSTSPGQDGDSFGTAVWIEGSKCHVTESKWVLSGVPPSKGYSDAHGVEKLPGIDVPSPKTCNSDAYAVCNYTLQSALEEEILRGLVKDALRKAVRAYGGKTLFGGSACSRGIISGNSGSPIVQQELQMFCSGAK
jgi:hypothetical protein